jgi:hypothetical protein
MLNAWEIIAYKILAGKHKERGSVGRLRCIWENNNKVYGKEIEWEGVDWINLF